MVSSRTFTQLLQQRNESVPRLFALLQFVHAFCLFFKSVILRHRFIWLLRIGNGEFLLDALISYCNRYFFQYCLGGCNPLASYSLDSCTPNPVCQNTTVSYGRQPSGNQG